RSRGCQMAGLLEGLFYVLRGTLGLPQRQRVDGQPLPVPQVRLAVFLLATLALARAQTAEDLIRQGDVRDGQNQNQEALVLFLQADTIQPNDAEILRRIAKQYDQLAVIASSKAEKK